MDFYADKRAGLSVKNDSLGHLKRVVPDARKWQRREGARHSLTYYSIREGRALRLAPMGDRKGSALPPHTSDPPFLMHIKILTGEA